MIITARTLHFSTEEFRRMADLPKLFQECADALNNLHPDFLHTVSLIPEPNKFKNPDGRLYSIEFSAAPLKETNA